MYRAAVRELTRDTGCSARAVILILPNYMKFRDRLLKDVIRRNFHVINKTTVTLSGSELYKFNLSNFNVDGCSTYTDPSQKSQLTVILVQGEDIFHQLELLAKDHDSVAVKFTGHRGLYCSANNLDAFDDIRRFFPESALTDEEFSAESLEYLDKHILPVISRVLAQCSVENPSNPIEWVADKLKERSKKASIRNYLPVDSCSQ